MGYPQSLLPIDFNYLCCFFTGMCKTCLYSLSNINKNNLLDIGVFENLSSKDIQKHLDSNLSPDYVLINLPFWRSLPVGWGYEFFCMYLFTGKGSFCTLNILYFIQIKMVYITISSNCVSSITTYSLYIINIYG